MPRRRARAAPRLAMSVVLLVRLQPLASDIYPLLVALEKLRD